MLFGFSWCFVAFGTILELAFIASSILAGFAFSSFVSLAFSVVAISAIPDFLVAGWCSSWNRTRNGLLWQVPHQDWEVAGASIDLTLLRQAVPLIWLHSRLRLKPRFLQNQRLLLFHPLICDWAPAAKMLFLREWNKPNVIFSKSVGVYWKYPLIGSPFHISWFHDNE